MDHSILLIDKVCSNSFVEKEMEFYLIGVACLMVSVKVKGDGTMKLEHVQSYLNNRVTSAEAMSYELFIIETLNYDLDFLTPFEISCQLLTNGLGICLPPESFHSQGLQDIHRSILLGILHHFSPY